MISYRSLFVLVGVFQVITSQGPPIGLSRFENIPEKCRQPLQGVENPENCCQVMPIYTEDEMVGCESIQRRDNFKNRPAVFDCFRPLCLLRKKGLVVNDNVDFAKFKEFLRQWSRNGPFKNTVELALKVCAQQGKVPGPPQVCEPGRLMRCVGGYFFANCPETHWLETDSCKAVKQRIKDCNGSVK